MRLNDDYLPRFSQITVPKHASGCVKTLADMVRANPT